MSELWEYQAENLLAFRAMQRTDGKTRRRKDSYRNNLEIAIFEYSLIGKKISSTFVPHIWPTSGYVKSYCFPKQRRWVSGGGHEALKKHSFHKDCVCGIYGCLDIRTTRIRGQIGYRITSLIEASGEMVIGRDKVIRTSAAQVVGIVNDTDWRHHLLDHDIFASKYFSVPIIELDQAKEMINEQMKKWSVVL